MQNCAVVKCESKRESGITVDKQLKFPSHKPTAIVTKHTPTAAHGWMHTYSLITSDCFLRILKGKHNTERCISRLGNVKKRFKPHLFSLLKRIPTITLYKHTIIFIWKLFKDKGLSTLVKNSQKELINRN